MDSGQRATGVDVLVAPAVPHALVGPDAAPKSNAETAKGARIGATTFLGESSSRKVTLWIARALPDLHDKVSKWRRGRGRPISAGFCLKVEPTSSDHP
jgi:hypothetical protein